MKGLRMPRNGSNVYSKAAGTTAAPNTTIESAKFNLVIDDLVVDQNAARPIESGGTAATNPAAARTNLFGVSTTTDKALARYNGATGALQNSVVTVSDAGAISGLTGMAMTGDANITGNVSATGNIQAATAIVGNGAGFSSSLFEAAGSTGIVMAVEYTGGVGGGPIGANRSSSDGALGLWYRGGIQVGSVSTTGGVTAYNTTSDYRVKQDIEPYSGGLDAVISLTPCTFAMKMDPEKRRQIGFIAHEVQAVLPLAVTGEKDAVDEAGNMVIQQLDQTKIIPALVSANQELYAMVIAQQAAIEALQTQVSTLQNNAH